MKRRETYRVKELAQASGVSVRTLHHYDEVGLLVPKGRSRAGYRLYDAEDLLRLQQILIGRELGLALEEIRRSLDDPRFDRKQALLAQRQALQARAQKTSEMIRAVDSALAILDEKAGAEMELQRLFDGFDPAKYEADTAERYGHTEFYAESARRTKAYTPEDWREFQEEQASIYGALFAALQAGEAADSARAMEVAERHRLSIDRWFYPCSHAMHVSLAEGYAVDSRFAENIDRFGAGLTPFLSAAIRANARRVG